MKSIIYYNSEKMQEFMPVFKRISECKSCKIDSRRFAIDSKVIIKEPIDDKEIEFNNYQKEAFNLGFDRVIYSFNI